MLPMLPDLPPSFGDTTPVQLFRLLLMVSNHVRTRMDARLAVTGVTTQQAAALTIVAQTDPPPTLGRVAGLMGTSHQNVRQIVAALERKGLVCVTVDPADRRARRITVTPAVDDLFGARDDDDHAEVARWFAVLSEHEQALAVSLLARVLKHVVGSSGAEPLPAAPT